MNTQKQQAAFTIVELLIVIVVIGILAAITIVAYNGIQNRANDTTVQSDLANISKKMNLFYVDNSRYPSSSADLTAASIDVSNGAYSVSPAVQVNLVYCVKTPDYSGYVIFAKSKSGSRYYVRETGSPTIDATGTAWDGTTTTLSSQCSALGYSMMVHGYFIGDTTTGPWRSWIGGN